MKHLVDGKRIRTLLGGLGIAVLLPSLVGCGMGTMQATSGLSASGGQGSAMQGSAHGGQQPITGATVKLFAAGTGGYGAGAAPIALTKTVTTSDGTGVTITGYSIASGVATFTAANSFSIGDIVTLNGFPVATSNSLNGQTVTVLPAGLSGTQFETNITGSDTTSADAGTANFSTNTNANPGNVYNTLQAGGFTISGDYTCPTVAGGSQVYVVITGGNPGITPSTGNTVAGNPNLALMTAIGACGSGGNLSSVPFVAIDEYSTVAAVAALQQFMAAPASGNALAPSIGAPSTTDAGYSIATQGLINAFNMVPNLSDLGTGNAPTATSLAAIAGATPESTKIGLIANILASCINSGVSGTALPLTGPSTPCATLFTDAMPAGASTTPTDTIQAAWYMLQSANYYGSAANGGFYTSAGTPTSTASATANVAAFNTYVSTLVGLATPQPIYPAVSSATDFTIAVSFAPTYGSNTYAVNAPNYVAIDQYGNAWFGNLGEAGGSAIAPSVTELSPSGAVIMNPVTSFTANGSSGFGVVSQSAFVAPTSNTRTFVNPGGSTIPVIGLAIDTTGQAWVPNYGDDAAAGTARWGTVAVFSASSGAGTGSTGASTGYYVGGLPYMAAVDGNNNVFLTIAGNSSSAYMDEKSITELPGGTGTGLIYNNTGISSSSHPNAFLASSSGGGLLWLALDNDATQNIWVNQNQSCKVATATTFGALDEFEPTTTAIPVNSNANYVSALGLAGGAGCSISANGYVTSVAAPTQNTYGVVADRYNNLWIADEFTSSSGFDGLTYYMQNPTLGSSAGASTGVIASANTTTYVDNGAVGGTNMKKPYFSVLDGNNNLWIANNGINAVSKAAYTPTTGIVLESPNKGFPHTGISGAQGIAVDPSGNIWVTNATNSGGSYTGANGATVIIGNAVTVIVGAAAPTVTPLSVALKANKIGQLP